MKYWLKVKIFICNQPIIKKAENEYHKQTLKTSVEWVRGITLGPL